MITCFFFITYLLALVYLSNTFTDFFKKKSEISKYFDKIVIFSTNKKDMRALLTELSIIIIAKLLIYTIKVVIFLSYAILANLFHK